MCRKILPGVMGCLLAVGHCPLLAAPLGTGFTYQGRLHNGASPASGLYDFTFALWNAATNGDLVSTVLTNRATPVSNGLFTATLDFGAAAFDGAGRWLEIAVCTNGGGVISVLLPRQPVQATPYALLAQQLPYNASPVFGGVVRFEAADPPFQVVHPVKVANLNADLVDGLEASAFLLRTQQCVGSMSELRGFPPGSSPSVLLLGYHSPRDGGGGVFQWEGGATEEDDGGTIIAPGGGGPAGRWKRLVNGPLSIRYFGATGSGATNDGAALQATIRCAAAGGGGGMVYVPRGTYKVTHKIVLETRAETPANGLTLAGEGSGSFLAFDHDGLDGRGIAIYASGVSNVTVRDLRVGSFPGGGLSSGLHFVGGRNITIRNNDISGVCLTNSGYAAAIYLAGGVQDVRILDNDLHDNGVSDRSSYHILVNADMAGRGATRLQIRGNLCGPNRAPGGAEPTAGICIFNSTYVSLTENHIEGVRYATGGVYGDRASGYGIVVYRGAGSEAHHLVVQGNTVKRTGGCGIYVQGIPYAAITGNLVEDVAREQPAETLVVGGIGVNLGPASITGNVIRNVGEGNTNHYKPFGIGVQTCSSTTNDGSCDYPDGVGRGITISGNTIEGTTGFGIALEAGKNSAADNCTLSGNTLVNTAGGISTVGDQPISGLTIIGNSIVRSPIVPDTNGYPGINLNGVADSIIAQNVVANASGQGILLHTNARRTVVSGNVVRDAGQALFNQYQGIQIGGTNNLVIGNQSYSSQPSVSVHNAGLFETGERNDLQGNNVAGSARTIAEALQSYGVGSSHLGNRVSDEASQGVTDLMGGRILVRTTEVLPGDAVQVTRLQVGGTPGHLSVTNVTNGSFSIVSSEEGDSSRVLWKILH